MRPRLAIAVGWIGLACFGGTSPQAGESADASRARKLDLPQETVSVRLPDEAPAFPPGAGAEIASSQCVICHSPDMVLYQPARTVSEWKATINKMRTTYGAPLPAGQVDALAAYLASLTAAN